MRSSNEGVIRTTAVTCRSCRSNEFFRNAQSELCCIYCGLEIVDFVVESQEMAGKGDDGDGIVFGTKATVPRSSRKSQLLQTPSATQLQRADVFDLLAVYQFALVMLAKECVQILCSSQRMDGERKPSSDIVSSAFEQDFLAVLQDVWFNYLNRWKASNSCCQLLGAFSEQHVDGSYCFCPDPRRPVHPVFLSKPMILGFLYLALRLQRTDCIPSDIVRWCERGLLPYYNMWEWFPETVKQTLETTKHSAQFFTRSHPTRLTPMNIFFQTTSLAVSLGIELPPLNAPAVALGMITALGLPKQTWTNYALLTRLFDSPHDEKISAKEVKEPLIGASGIDQQYPEFVLACVVVAFLLCDRWSEQTLYNLTLAHATDLEAAWSLHHFEAVAGVLAFSEVERGVLPRSLLPPFLRQTRRVLGNIVRRHINEADMEKMDGMKAINRFVLPLLDQWQVNGSFVPPVVIASSSSIHHQDSAARGDDETTTVSHSAAASKHVLDEVYVSGEALVSESLSEEEQEYMHRLDHRPTISTSTYSTSNNPSDGMRLFPSYARHEEDITGQRSPSWTLVLERAAQFLYLPPLLLQQIVDTIDRQIVLLVMNGKRSAVRYREFEEASTLGRAHFSHLYDRFQRQRTAADDNELLVMVEEDDEDEEEGRTERKTLAQRLQRLRDESAQWQSVHEESLLQVYREKYQQEEHRDVVVSGRASGDEEEEEEDGGDGDEKTTKKVKIDSQLRRLLRQEVIDARMYAEHDWWRDTIETSIGDADRPQHNREEDGRDNNDGDSSRHGDQQQPYLVSMDEEHRRRYYDNGGGSVNDRKVMGTGEDISSASSSSSSAQRQESEDEEEGDFSSSSSSVDNDLGD